LPKTAGENPVLSVVGREISRAAPRSAENGEEMREKERERERERTATTVVIISGGKGNAHT